MRILWSREEILKTFEINSQGDLVRIMNNGTKKIIEPVANKNGSRHITYKGKDIAYQTIIWIMAYGYIADEYARIKHINGNKLDNRIENLKLISKYP